MKSGRDAAADSLKRRQLRSGLPAVLSGAINTAVPLSGAFFLSPNEYVVWALSATLITIFLVFDFGTPTLATKLSAERALDHQVCVRLIVLTSAPPIALGIIAVLLWPPYSDATGIAGADIDPRWVLAAVGVGTSMRSAGAIYSSALLGRFQARRRAASLLIPSTVQLTVTVAALAAGTGVLALGIGAITSGLLQLTVGRILLGDYDPASGVDQATRTNVLIKEFFRIRGLISLLGLSVTQLDRWALATIASPSLTSTYDLCARFALLPKIAIIAFSAGLVAEGARAQKTRDVMRIKHRAQRLLFLAMPLTVLWTLSASAIANRFEAPAAVVILTSVGLALGHGFNTVTLIPSLLLASRGAPRFELRYVIPLSIGIYLVYLAAAILGDFYVFVVGWSLVMIAASAWFVHRSDKYLERVDQS